MLPALVLAVALAGPQDNAQRAECSQAGGDYVPAGSVLAGAPAACNTGSDSESCWAYGQPQSILFTGGFWRSVAVENTVHPGCFRGRP